MFLSERCAMQINLLPSENVAYHIGQRRCRRLLVPIFLTVTISSFAICMLLLSEVEGSDDESTKRQDVLLQSVLERVEKLSKEIEQEYAKLQMRKERSSRRTRPVMLLDEITRKLPERLSLTEIRYKSSGAWFRGIAQNQDVVMEFRDSLVSLGARSSPVIRRTAWEQLEGRMSLVFELDVDFGAHELIGKE